jgi:chromosome segregation ATPase
MERMKHTGDYELDRINMLEQECADLEEENKKLKEDNDKLQEKVNTYSEEYGKLREEKRNLKEKVETLELWLDNKEKLNEEYRDKIDLLKYQSY